jgi:NAD dependent epimerase/dehydratase family enzyme
MKEFSEVLADVAKGYQWVLPVPAFGLKIAMGEMSKVLLNSNRVSAQKVLDNGFVFKFESLAEALKDLL